MNTRTPKSTTVKKRINHDSMWLKCDFPSGCRLKVTIRRYEISIDHLFLPYESAIMVEANVIREWIKENSPTYGEMFQRLETLCESCMTGKELISKMK